MDLLRQYASWLAVMALLLACSAFFSGSEAALFYLGRFDRRRLAAGNRAQRIAAALLAEPDRLLTAILFWNLLVNLSFFTLGSIVSLRRQQAGRSTVAGALALGAMVAIIVFGELLPKSLAVMRPAALAPVVAIPLRVLVGLLDPALARLPPGNAAVAALALAGVRAASRTCTSATWSGPCGMSTADAALVEQEQKVLESIVALSETRADELMRRACRSPCSGRPSRWPTWAGACRRAGTCWCRSRTATRWPRPCRLAGLYRLPAEHLEQAAQPVVYVPWSTTAAEVLDRLQRQGRRVAAVVNEFGETIGIITLDDLLEGIFSQTPSPSEPLLRRPPIRQVRPGVWHVTGMTGVRQLIRCFDRPGLPTKSVTVGGVVQEVLERLPQRGDECRWGPYQLKVLDVPARGRLLLELTFAAEESP